MVAYLKCACGRYKLLAKKLAEQGYEIRYVNMNPAWKKEAQLYNLRLPFIVEDEMNKVGKEV